MGGYSAGVAVGLLLIAGGIPAPPPWPSARWGGGKGRSVAPLIFPAARGKALQGGSGVRSGHKGPRSGTAHGVPTDPPYRAPVHQGQVAARRSAAARIWSSDGITRKAAPARGVKVSAPVTRRKGRAAKPASTMAVTMPSPTPAL